MTKRRPGSLGGNQGGGSNTRNIRSRRQSQKAAKETGANLGPGLKEDALGRISIRQIPGIDPGDPKFNRLLVQALQAAGIMER